MGPFCKSCFDDSPLFFCSQSSFTLYYYVSKIEFTKTPIFDHVCYLKYWDLLSFVQLQILQTYLLCKNKHICDMMLIHNFQAWLGFYPSILIRCYCLVVFYPGREICCICGINNRRW